MCHCEMGEGIRVVMNSQGRSEALEVCGEGGLVVEGQHSVAHAGRHDHRISHGAPTVLHSDADRALRPDGRPHNGVLEDTLAVELPGRLHLQTVAGTPTDERDLHAQHAVCPADNFLLVSAEPVAQDP